MTIRRFAAIFLALILSHTSLVRNAWGADEFTATASIKPIHSILTGLMIGTDSPELLVTGNQTPFDAEIDAKQMARLSEARLIVWVGPELEAFLIEPLKNPGLQTHVVTLLDNPALKILPSRRDDSKRDPYLWLDSRNGIILIDELTKALVAVDPARSHLYKRNRHRLMERMSKLDRKLEYGYRGLKGGIGLAYYDTQQYFEQAYALKIGGVLAHSPKNEVLASDLLDQRIRVMKDDYACLLIERPLPASHLDLLVRESAIEIGSLDSFGTQFEPGPDLYFNVMAHNTNVIKACLWRGDNEVEPAPSEDAQSAELRGRFILIDHKGHAITDKDMLGTYQLLFFGYISCPDICPTSLLTGSKALDLLGEKAHLVQPYFITVDPARDTVEIVDRYVHFFDDRIIGLTGTEAMIARVAKQYNVKYEKVFTAGGDSNSYAMDHTASFFLIDPNGRFVTKFAYGLTAEQLAEKLDEHISPH